MMKYVQKCLQISSRLFKNIPKIETLIYLYVWLVFYADKAIWHEKSRLETCHNVQVIELDLIEKLSEYFDRV